MGNFPSNGHTRELGRNAKINFIKGEEYWTVSYVDGRIIELTLEKLIGKNDKSLRFQLSGSINKKALFFFINRAKNRGLLFFGDKKEGLLQEIEFGNIGGKFYDLKFDEESEGIPPLVNKTSVFLHSLGYGLLVVQQSRSSANKMPCIVTLRHYYGVSSGNDYSRIQLDIGLSMMVRIWLLNDGEFSISMEGPTQHDWHSVYRVITDVSRTRSWKRTSCPLNLGIKKLHESLEIEDEENRDNLLPARHQFPRNHGGLVYNYRNSFEGNFCGSHVHIEKYVEQENVQENVGCVVQ